MAAGLSVAVAVAVAVAVGVAVGVAVVGVGVAVRVGVGDGLLRVSLIGVSVTVPTLLPFSVSWPPAVTATITDEPAEAAAPRSSATLREVPTPFATAPVVFTLMLHGFTVTVWPFASAWPAGNDEPVTTKMHEPKRSVPVAELPPDAILNPGLLLEPVNVTVVSEVVPNCGTPDENENGVSASAAVMVPLAAKVVSEATPSCLPEAEALDTGIGEDEPDPPVHASETTTTAASASALESRRLTGAPVLSFMTFVLMDPTRQPLHMTSLRAYTAPLLGQL